ncbi:hypothetical protein [Microvirga sp. G4-2]|uniref:hypothetical protein n=1 Tax=Microvirga sp. G4-2 TaxID=3434467 RepID=UPI00404427FC
MDQVYETKQPFVGRRVPFLMQNKPGCSLEEHILDLVYHLVEDLVGRVTGILVESFDRTDWARA